METAICEPTTWWPLAAYLAAAGGFALGMIATALLTTARIN